jgi:hypothetical protein
MQTETSWSRRFVRRFPSTARKTMEEEVGGETHTPQPMLEYTANNLATRSESLKQEILENQGLVEIPAFSPTARICPAQLKQHIRDNVMLLFYTPDGKQRRYESFGECDSVYKLYPKAGREREEKHSEGG